MSIERWDDDRLDRLANMIESNDRVIQALGNRVDSMAIATPLLKRLIAISRCFLASASS